MLPAQSCLCRCVRDGPRGNPDAFSNRSRAPPERARCLPSGQSLATSFPNLPSCEYPILRGMCGPYQCTLPAAGPATHREPPAVLQTAIPATCPARRYFEGGFAAPRASDRAPLASDPARSRRLPRLLCFPCCTLGAPPENPRPAQAPARFPDETPAPNACATPDSVTPD